MTIDEFNFLKRCPFPVFFISLSFDCAYPITGYSNEMITFIGFNWICFRDFELESFRYSIDCGKSFRKINKEAV